MNYYNKKYRIPYRIDYSNLFLSFYKITEMNFGSIGSVACPKEIIPEEVIETTDKIFFDIDNINIQIRVQDRKLIVKNKHRYEQPHEIKF